MPSYLVWMPGVSSVNCICIKSKLTLLWRPSDDAIQKRVLRGNQAPPPGRHPEALVQASVLFFFKAMTWHFCACAHTNTKPANPFFFESEMDLLVSLASTSNREGSIARKKTLFLHSLAFLCFYFFRFLSSSFAKKSSELDGLQNKYR